MDEGTHLNYWGAEKVSLFLGKYLQEKYNLKDKRKDPEYQSWNENYIKYKFEIDRKLGKNYDYVKDTSLIQYLKRFKNEDDKIIFMSAKDEASRHFGKIYPILKELGLTI